jgi:CO/xanthine dehydrogenase Mo-binding subunit
MMALDPHFRFLTDMTAPGLLHAAVLRSPYPHADIIEIDTGPARALHGVYGVVTATDIPGKNRFGVRHADQPYLCENRVRCVGDPVAAVAAETPEIARKAIGLIKVAWRVLPVAGDAHAALQAGAPELHPGGNLVHRTNHERGEVKAALARSAFIVEQTYHTPRQLHHFIEPEGAVAIPDGDSITIHAPGHWAEMEAKEIAAMLALPEARVRVVASPAGGSFGGKDCLHAQPIAALLAKATGRPVKLIWRREESFTIGVKRHPFTIHMRSGADADGRLTAHLVDLLADTGAYAQHGPEVLDTAHENAQGPYQWQAVRLAGRLAYTNNGISGAMRGFGAVQVQIALEQQIDRLASACGMDPYAFRRLNLRGETAPGQLGQTLAAPSWHSRALAALPPATPPRRETRWLFGSAIALIEKNEGFAQSGPNQGQSVIMLAHDGIEIRTGLSDLGQGLANAGIAIAVSLIGCAPEDVTIVAGDSARTPGSGPVAASRGAGVLNRSLAAAAPAFTEAVIARAAGLTGEAPGSLAIGRGGVHHKGAPGNRPLVAWCDLGGPLLAATGHAPAIVTTDGEGENHALFSACGALAEVAVDSFTGRIRVVRMTMTPVTGPVLDAISVAGQMAGGASMAAGLVASEDLPAIDGHFRASNFDGYFAPSIADAFDVTVRCIDDIPPDISGPRGVGEIGTNAAAPAIVNAIHAATGFVCRKLPVDPEEMLKHLGSMPWR